MKSYRQKAEAALEAADNANARLKRLHENQTAPNRQAQISDAYGELRNELQKAKVYATLALAEGEFRPGPVETTAGQ